MNQELNKYYQCPDCEGVHHESQLIQAGLNHELCPDCESEAVLMSEAKRGEHDDHRTN